MRRVILDTNIYGEMVELGEADTLRNSILSRKDIVVYGFDIIRNELRRTSKELVIEKETKVWRNLRITLLNLYDSITRRDIPHPRRVNELAENYYNAYRELGGTTSYRKMENDFKIVAAASLSSLDIVVSEDNETMLNEIAIKCYRIVNQIKSLELPQFIGYKDFRKWFV